jgi:hypothetical protein
MEHPLESPNSAPCDFFFGALKCAFAAVCSDVDPATAISGVDSSGLFTADQLMTRRILIENFSDSRSRLDVTTSRESPVISTQKQLLPDDEKAVWKTAVLVQVPGLPSTVPIPANSHDHRKNFDASVRYSMVRGTPHCQLDLA